MAHNSSIESFRDALVAAIHWLDENGIDTRPTRFNAYLKSLNTAIDNDMVADPASPLFEQVLEALDSGGELVYIHRHLNTVNTVAMKDRLRNYCKGTMLERDESAMSSSNRARNFGFELVFAATLQRAGFNVEFPAQGDIQLSSPDVRVECKRPQKNHKIHSALSDANLQLRARPEAESAVNIIAVAIGKSIHGGSKLLTAIDPDHAKHDIGLRLDRLIGDHQHIWQTTKFKAVAAIWFFYSGVVAFTKHNMFTRGTYDRIVVRPDGQHPEREAVIRIIAAPIENSPGLEVF